MRRLVRPANAQLPRLALHRMIRAARRAAHPQNEIELPRRAGWRRSLGRSPASLAAAIRYWLNNWNGLMRWPRRDWAIRPIALNRKKPIRSHDAGAAMRNDEQ